MRGLDIILRVVRACAITTLSALLLWVITSAWALFSDPPTELNGATLVAAVYGGYFVAVISPWSWLYLPYQVILLGLGLNFRIFIIWIPMVGVLFMSLYLLTMVDNSAAQFGFVGGATVCSFAFVVLNSLILRPKVLEPLEHGDSL